MEDTAEGIVWVDGSVPCQALGLLDEPIGLEIVAGRIEHIRGRAKDVDTLERLFDGQNLTATRVLAEFGFGLIVWATLSGRMLEDEGCAGTIHLGFGSNATIGGRNRVRFIWILWSPSRRSGSMESDRARWRDRMEGSG